MKKDTIIILTLYYKDVKNHQLDHSISLNHTLVILFMHFFFKHNSHYFIHIITITISDVMGIAFAIIRYIPL